VNEDAIILKEYGEAFRKYAKNGVIDMDDHLRHKFNLQVHTLKEAIMEWGRVIPLMRQSQFFVLLLKKAAGEKRVGQFTFPLHQHMLIIIPKRVAHSTIYTSDDCSGYFLSFDYDFFLQNAFPKDRIINKKIFKTSIKPYLTLSESQEQRLSAIFETVLAEYNGAMKNKNQMLALKVLELLILCDRFFSDAESEKQECIYNEVVESFNELIEKNFSKHRSVQFYADALHIHPNHLNFLVRKYTGLTAKETIMSHILLEAKMLLHSSTLTIKEIAYELGFEDPTSFSSFFKRNVNLSPAKYKLDKIP
jgi:AraC family transcriptional activator of pobA